MRLSEGSYPPQVNNRPLEGFDHAHIGRHRLVVIVRNYAQVLLYRTENLPLVFTLTMSPNQARVHIFWELYLIGPLSQAVLLPSPWSLIWVCMRMAIK